MAIPKLSEFINKRRTTQSPDDVYQMDQQRPRTGQAWQNEIPQIDTSDAIGSLAGILGPSPEERAAEEARLQQHRQKMHGWTALFNGLRNLSNLYFTTKGAAPQKYGDPHQQIEQQYQDERKRLADIQAQNQKYYAGLWNMQRQVSDDKRRDLLAEAQAKYYGTRDYAASQKAEADQQKAELERLKAVRVIKQKDGSLMKFDPVSGTVEPLTEADPLYEELVRSQINRNNRTGTGRSSSGGGVTTTENTYNEDGKVVKKVVTKGGGPSRPSGSAKPSGGGQRRKVARKSKTQL